jgi:predicted membrane channel-forming protein YqfA (hemolysin III family)
MKKYWFKKYGWSYIPISITGSLITIFALLFSGWICWEICKRTWSDIGALICFFAYFTCIAFWWKWIAESTSEKTKEP